MKNLRYINAQGGILIEQDNGIDLYVDGGEIYEQALAGEFGAIAPFVAPAKSAEQLAYENNAPILAEIESLEKKAIRSTRELALDPSNVTARTLLRDIEDQITVQRGKLL